jgi:transglutaminase-like putative cysteine protease
MIGLAVGPAIQSNRPWIDVKKIGATPAGQAEHFNWQQTYRPLTWPHRGTTVLDVQARFPRYWKAQDLDLFNGTAWASAAVGGAYPLYGVSNANIDRWTEKLTVTIRAMSTREVIAAGTASPPVQAGGMVLGLGSAPGTYLAQQPLRSGDSYQVDVYAPAPSRRQLAAAGSRYPLAELAPDLQLLIPQAGSQAVAQPIQFAPYGSPGRVRYNPAASLSGTATQQFVASSAYAPALRLAERLKAATRTPYQYVRAVMAYLSRGYTYDQSPPTGRYPLITFLFGSRRGYCQQFAGAMALLLRMGGVPARVAVGFTSGTLDSATHTYVVSDLDAHAWVEAWFPSLGWVTFDPTPAEDPALRGLPPTPFVQADALQPRHQIVSPHTGGQARPAALVGRRDSKHASRSSGGGVPAWLVIVPLLALLGALSLAGWRRARTPEALLEELERAFARCGRPLAPAVTLAELERQMADAPAAAAYLRTLRCARYAGHADAPTPEQRRAVRRRLRRGLGLLGSLRALVALPPSAGRVSWR